MTDPSESSLLARVRNAKRAEDRPPSITGTKLMLFGIHLSLVGALVPQWYSLVFAGLAVSALGLLVSA